MRTYISNMESKIELDVIVIPEGEGKDKIYSITSVQIPNVVTQGKNLEEAKSRLKEALGLYFEEVPEEKLRLIKIVNNKENTPLISRIFI